MGLSINKVALIGNAAGGKTRLSVRLSQQMQIPATHVDSIQFLPGMIIRPLQETRSLLNEIVSEEQWIIDGFGPLDLLEARFQIADRIILVDLPLWRHYWWLFKRQMKTIWRPRPELPLGCRETSLLHVFKLIKTVWRIHYKMRPELLRILGRPDLKPKVIIIQNLKAWNKLFETGI